MGICKKCEFCRKFEEYEIEDVEKIKLICKSSRYEDCEHLFDANV